MSEEPGGSTGIHNLLDARCELRMTSGVLVPCLNKELRSEYLVRYGSTVAILNKARSASHTGVLKIGSILVSGVHS